MNEVSLEFLRNKCAVFITVHRFGNTRKMPLETAKPANWDTLSKDEKAKLAKVMKLNINLVDPESDKLAAVNSYMTESAQRIQALCVTSFLKKGLYFCKNEVTGEIMAIVRQVGAKLQDELIPALLEAWPTYKMASQQVLEPKGLWREAEYPSLSDLADSFDIEVNFTALGVPEGLPDDVRQQAEADLKQKCNEIENEIKLALMSEVSGALGHISERLKTPAGEKPKTFRNTLLDDLLQFLNTFHARNMASTAEFDAVIEQLRQVMKDVSDENKTDMLDKLREGGAFRDQLAQRMGEIKGQVDTMIENVPQRRFDLED